MDLFRLANRLRNNLKMLTDGLLVLTAETGSDPALALWRRYMTLLDDVERLTGKLAEVLAELSR